VQPLVPEEAGEAEVSDDVGDDLIFEHHSGGLNVAAHDHVPAWPNQNVAQRAAEGVVIINNQNRLCGYEYRRFNTGHPASTPAGHTGG